jgi:hypothetical protein
MTANHFDACSDPAREPAAATGTSSSGSPFLGIHFRCCKTYGRIYRSASGSEYLGRCPRCQVAVRVPIRPGGSSTRFFQAG